MKDITKLQKKYDEIANRVYEALNDMEELMETKEFKELDDDDFEEMYGSIESFVQGIKDSLKHRN